MVHEIENFYGVYLLYNINPRFKGRTYIGFTVNPNRRIKQHNKGRQAGGAWRTHGRGPWEMVLIIHGFPNEISALRFEWAWQNPEKSRRLRHLDAKKKKESPFEYRFRIVSNMLRTGPWNRLGLTIRWLKQEYIQDFSHDCMPPIHMPVAYGPVKIKKVSSDTVKTASDKKSQDMCTESDNDDDNGELKLLQTNSKFTRCAVCRKIIEADDNTLNCVHPKCTSLSHILCLSNKFLSTSNERKDQIIPVEGHCPKCKQPTLWADLIRFKTGCYQNLEECRSSDEDDNDDHWANELQTQPVT